MLFKKPEKIEKIDASSINSGLYLKVDANGKIIGGSGGGSSYTKVDTFDSLPAASSYTDEIFFVRQTTGSWLLGTQKKSGHYYSNGTTWTYAPNIDKTLSLKVGEVLIDNAPEVELIGGTNISLGASAEAKTVTINVSNDADVVHKTGDETIAGVKTFSSPIVGSGASLTAINWQQVNAGTSTIFNGYTTNFTTTAGAWTKFPTLSINTDSQSEFNATDQKFVSKSNQNMLIFINLLGSTVTDKRIRVYRNGSFYKECQTRDVGCYFRDIGYIALNGYYEFYYYTDSAISVTTSFWLQKFPN